MNKLKQCPFCGADFYKADDDGWLRIDHSPNCYLVDLTFVSTWSISEENTLFFEDWNTRYEHTCNIEPTTTNNKVFLELIHEYECLNCERLVAIFADYGKPNYCPYCGVKAVE